MRFESLFPDTAAGVDIGKTLVFVHVDVSGRDVRILEPDLRGNSFLEGFAVRFAGYLFKSQTQNEIAGIAVGMLRVRFKIRPQSV